MVAEPFSEEVAEAAYRLLEHTPRPTAVLWGTDILAVGIYQAAARLGLQIPADLSVAAIALHGLSHVLYPTLTALPPPWARWRGPPLNS